MQSDQVLGPCWSLQELRTFYILLKAHGQQWEKLQERLPQRSVQMVRSLFDMHRGYLSLSEASAEGFCTIMMDHYDAQEKQRRIIANEKSKRNATEYIKPEKVEEAVEKNSKRRRLDSLLGTKHLQASWVQTENHETSLKRSFSLRKRRIKPEPWRARAWLLRQLSIDKADDAGLTALCAPKFDLPWSHWFYSYVDVDFFARNEFIECLSGMGLDTVTSAARPIWSSVRASMGRPRRLSRVFFAQERQTLEAYRLAKRGIDPMHTSGDTSWPYQGTPLLRPGTTIIAWVESERRFRLATVLEVRATAGACQVVYFGSELQTDVVECSLDNVMALDCPLWFMRSQTSIAVLKAASRDHKCHENSLMLMTSKSSGPIGERHRDKKCHAYLAVKALLHRKEQIVMAIANLNARVAELQMRLHEKKATKSSIRTTLAVVSAAVVKDLKWTNLRKKQQLKKQHSWLAANLDATNRRLKAALLSLRSFSNRDSYEEEISEMGVADIADTLEESSTVPGETLTERHMRWAIDFLAASKRKAGTVVMESALQIAKDNEELRISSSSNNNTCLREVLPETMELVANCVTLMSALHRHVAGSPDVPSVVTQKLVERVLELLKPTYKANMDLHMELRAAAEAAQAQMSVQASTSKVE